ncbi:MAG: hypothetical protein RLZZ387_222 [Chloroflexota bacterium]|jgi:PAS domain S-box-containing protein
MTKQQSIWWWLVAILLIGLISLGLLEWSHRRWRTAMQTQVTALDNLSQARHQVMMGYLSIDRAAAGDPSFDTQDALAHLDRAELALNDWLQGESTLIRMRGTAPSDPELLDEIRAYARDIDTFRSLAAQSLTPDEDTRGGEAVELRAVFANLERRAGALEDRLYTELGNVTLEQERRQLVTLLLWVIFLTVIGTTVYQVIDAQRRAVAMLADREERFRTLVEGSPLLIAVHDTGRLTYLNPAGAALLGASPAELVGRPIREFVLPADWPGALARIEGLHARGRPADPALQHWVRTDGVELAVEVTDIPFHDHDRPAVYVVAQDITQRVQAEAKLVRAQKMESVGRLAGGIAHDFNNLLTGIIGFADLALDDLSPDDPVYGDLMQIRQVAERAALLTAQLLAFARKQVLQPRALDLSALVRDLELLLRRLLPESVELHLRLADDLWPVSADPGQIEQVLVNLVLNARDAMPGGGLVTIQTANIAARDGAGDAVRLEVSDTGNGMTPEVQARAFEPFFTTKGAGQGTGLGLAMCEGIVVQHGGQIGIESAVGEGTRIAVELPRFLGAPEPKEIRIARHGHMGSETVLVVEDEPQVRAVVVRALEAQGYRVIEASNGLEALAALERQPGLRIDLLLTDVVMPHMGGPELVAVLAARIPGLRVVFMSGYADRPAELHLPDGSGTIFLPKPFTPAAVAQVVREALDQPR